MERVAGGRQARRGAHESCDLALSNIFWTATSTAASSCTAPHCYRLPVAGTSLCVLASCARTAHAVFCKQSIDPPAGQQAWPRKATWKRGHACASRSKAFWVSASTRASRSIHGLETLWWNSSTTCAPAPSYHHVATEGRLPPTGRHTSPMGMQPTLGSAHRAAAARGSVRRLSSTRVSL